MLLRLARSLQSDLDLEHPSRMVPPSYSNRKTWQEEALVREGFSEGIEAFINRIQVSARQERDDTSPIGSAELGYLEEKE